MAHLKFFLLCFSAFASIAHGEEPSALESTKVRAVANDVASAKPVRIAANVKLSMDEIAELPKLTDESVSILTSLVLKLSNSDFRNSGAKAIKHRARILTALHILEHLDARGSTGTLIPQTAKTNIIQARDAFRDIFAQASEATFSRYRDRFDNLTASLLGPAQAAHAVASDSVLVSQEMFERLCRRNLGLREKDAREEAVQQLLAMPSWSSRETLAAMMDVQENGGLSPTLQTEVAVRLRTEMVESLLPHATSAQLRACLEAFL